jgi:hypothetical protein
MSIQVNSHARLNWTVEDLNGKLGLETTNCRPWDSSSGIDGINIGMADAVKGKAALWISVEEAKSLRDWLVKTLPDDSGADE